MKTEELRAAAVYPVTILICDVIDQAATLAAALERDMPDGLQPPELRPLRDALDKLETA